MVFTLNVCTTPKDGGLFSYQEFQAWDIDAQSEHLARRQLVEMYLEQGRFIQTMELVKTSAKRG